MILKKKKLFGFLSKARVHVLYIYRKDVNGFFAYPVNDMIAPGYSSIILHPMDLSTMMSKIDSDQYRNVVEYKVSAYFLYSLLFLNNNFPQNLVFLFFVHKKTPVKRF